MPERKISFGWGLVQLDVPVFIKLLQLLIKYVSIMEDIILMLNYISNDIKYNIGTFIDMLLESEF